MRLRYGVLVAAWCFLVSVGCSSGAVVVIVNESGETLRNVSLSGSGFSAHLEEIAARRRVTVAVQPKGESGVRLQFSAAGRTMTFGPAGYMEADGGYVTTLTISPQLAVNITTELLP